MPAGPARSVTRPASLALAGALLAIAAAGQIPRPSKATLELATGHTAYAAGATARIAATVAIDDGWHLNSHWPTYEWLIPTELTLELPEGWDEPTVTYPEGVLRRFAFATEQPLSVYEESVVLLAELTVPDGWPEGPVAVRGVLGYQACDDRSCLPPSTAEADLELIVGANGESTGAVPAAVAAAAPPETGGGAPRPASLLLILSLGVLGGLILNAMPCVLPVLSLKLFGLLRSAAGGRSEVVSGSLATAGGILFSFWALAAAAVGARALGATVGWGVQFQEPVFVTVLAVIVVLFSLNLWGLFEIPLPGFVSRLGSSGPREGAAGHFATGLFATLMATPCSAPFLGTAISFALAKPPAAVFAVFTAIGVGMALPYLLLAIRPSSVRWLPKPGPWMDGLKGVLGFLLAGAAIWLFYVLGAQMSAQRLAAIELAVLALALFVWGRRRSSGAWRGLAAAGIAASLAGAVVLAAGAGRAPAGRTQAADAREGRIAWTPFDRAEAERLAAEGRLVFVDVTADWCFTCKVNERLVLETEEVAAAFERHGVIALKADWTNRNPAIAEFLADHGRYGIPFYLLYRPGDRPHLFAELLTRDGLIKVLDGAASDRTAEVARGAGR